MYDELLQALKLTGIPTAEGDWDRAPQEGSYMVLRLDYEASALWADNHQRQQALEGSVHLFLRSGDKYDFRQIQGIFDAMEISWRLAATLYEPRNHTVHYEWAIQLEVL